MQTFIIISTVFGILYVMQISWYAYGFKKLKSFQFKQSELNFEDKTYISLIIPFKNEEKHLPKLIESLEEQTLNKQYFKIVFVDDHSADYSVPLIQEYIRRNTNIKLLHQDVNEKGKKHALLKGISETNSELIVTSDADCIHNPMWLETILHYYLEFNPKMIIAPVILTGDSYFQKNQSLEFLSLIGVTAGAAGINRPTMCNGANLVFQRAAFESFSNPFNMTEQSGDDIFLLHNIKKKYPGEIHYLKSEKAVVYTNAEKSFKSFFKQRLRWASKSKSYLDIDTIISSILVLLTNVFIISLFIISFFDKAVFLYFISFFSLKLFVDFILLYLTAHFFKQKYLLHYFPLLNILYPFYISITALSSLFSGKINW